ncbi:MAG TPA: hypothetical protein VFS40_13190 [Gemmatimonadales bacterium]|nr:hypothetical protein [Gemmatimonadales bacterium]
MAFPSIPLRRLTVAAGLALALAACGESAPSTFDASATAADLDAAMAAFENPVVMSFSAFSGGMDAATGGSSAALGSLALHRAPGAPFAGAKAFAAAARTFAAGGGTATPAAGLSASSAAIPPAVLGKTFVYDEAQAQYVVSDRTGGPGNGVRFVLYAVNPATGQIVSPLNEIGYADLVDLSSGSTTSARLSIVSDGTTYLEYTASGSTTSTSASVRVDGFVTNGTTRANFDLDTKLVGSPTGGSTTLDYSLDVPQRKLALDYQLSFTTASGADQLSLDLSLKGPNGWVNITGKAQPADGAQFDVKVNGEGFAKLTSDGTTVTFTDENGQPLTEADRTALAKIWDWVDAGFGIFIVLLSPLGSLFGG